MKRIILTIATFSLGFLMVSAQNPTTQEQETTIKSKSPSIQQKIENSQPSYKIQPQHSPAAQKQKVSTSTQETTPVMQKSVGESVKSSTPATTNPASTTTTIENNVKNPVTPATPASKDANGVKTPATPASPALQNSQKAKSNGKSKRANNKK
jgi:hypothetical protein